MRLWNYIKYHNKISLAGIILAVVLISLVVVYVKDGYKPNKPICPDDYGTDDAGSAEYLASIDKWTNDFFDTHPDASILDWGEARHAF